MKIYNAIWRAVSIVALLAVGAWGFFGASGPAAETAARERAVLSLSGAQNVGNRQPGASVVVAEPMTVSTDEALVTMQTFQPAPSQYDRWLAGEIDLDEMEYRVGPAQRQELAEAAKQRNIPGMGQLDSTPELNSTAPTIDVSFDALDIDDCCGTGSSVPPDSDMAAGPNHLIAVENSSFAIYDKTGATVVAPILFDAFLTGHGASGTFDPTVQYDQEEGRWVMAIEDGELFYLMVSDDDNPVGTWYTYEFDAQFYGDEFFDYPHIGIGDHAIFMGANMFNGSIPGSFEGRIYAFEKDDAYANLPVTMVSASVGYDGGTPQPLNLTGWAQDSVPVPFNSHYFVTDYYDGATVWLWQWNNPFTGGVPTVVQTYDFGAVGASGYPVDVPQSGGMSVQANDWRMRSFEYRNGYAYVVDTVSYDWGTGDANVVRWHKLNLGAAGYPIVDGSFVGSSAPLHYIFPDVSADMCDNMVVGFERGGSTQFMETRLIGRLFTDPAGELLGSIQAKAGEATYTSFDGAPLRWGDYSGMAIDPDGRTFWHMGEYAKSGVSNPTVNYGNWITSSSYSQCSVRSFLDVPTNATTWSYIESVYNAGITGGCSTGPRNYCPNNIVNRAQMAIFLLRGIHGGSYTPPAATGTMFTDVSTGTFGAAWIEQLATEGISGGCGGGKFCPTSSVTRAQMAIFLLRAKYGSAYTPPAATGTMFTDVPIGLSTAAWIEQLATEGITSGCGGGKYCPNSTVSRGQMAIFIQRTFGLSLPPFP